MDSYAAGVEEDVGHELESFEDDEADLADGGSCARDDMPVDGAFGLRVVEHIWQHELVETLSDSGRTLPATKLDAGLGILAGALKEVVEKYPRIGEMVRAEFIDRFEGWPVNASVAWESAPTVSDSMLALAGVVYSDKRIIKKYSRLGAIIDYGIACVQREDAKNALVYVIDACGYIFKNKLSSAYEIGRIRNKEQAEKLLIRLGMDANDAKGLVKNSDHKILDVMDCAPGKPTFFEDEDGNTVVNSYLPPKIIPVQGSWARLAHLLWMNTGKAVVTEEIDGKLVEVHDHRPAEHVFNWMAAKVQQPGVRSFTATIISGPPGCGKTTIGKAFMEAVGRANCVNIDGTSLGDPFNSHYAGKLAAVVNEAAGNDSEERQHVTERLKAMLTDDEVTLKTPHLARVQIRNRITLLLTANPGVPIRIEGEDERRYNFFRLAPEQFTEGDKLVSAGLFDPITKDWDAKGLTELAAFMWDLQHYDVDWGRARKPFKNQDRSDVVTGTETAIESFFREVRETKGKIIGTMLAIREREAKGLSSVTEAMVYDLPDGMLLSAIHAAYGIYAKRLNGTYARTVGYNRFATDWASTFKATWPKKRSSHEASDGSRPAVAAGLALPELTDGSKVAVLEALSQATEEQLLKQLGVAQRKKEWLAKEPY